MYSIRRRLTLILAGGFATLIIGAGFYVAGSIREYLEREFDAGLRAKAQALAAFTVEEGGGEITFELLPGDMPEFEREKDPEYFQFFLLDGTPSPNGRSDRLEGDRLALRQLHSTTDADGRHGASTLRELRAPVQSLLGFSSDWACGSERGHRSSSPKRGQCSLDQLQIVRRLFVLHGHLPERFCCRLQIVHGFDHVFVHGAGSHDRLFSRYAPKVADRIVGAESGIALLEHVHPGAVAVRY